MKALNRNGLPRLGTPDDHKRWAAMRRRKADFDAHWANQAIENRRMGNQRARWGNERTTTYERQVPDQRHGEPASSPAEA